MTVIRHDRVEHESCRHTQDSVYITRPPVLSYTNYLPCVYKISCSTRWVKSLIISAPKIEQILNQHWQTCVRNVEKTNASNTGPIVWTLLGPNAGF